MAKVELSWRLLKVTFEIRTFWSCLYHQRAQVGSYFHRMSHCLSLIFLKNEMAKNKQELLKISRPKKGKPLSYKGSRFKCAERPHGTFVKEMQPWSQFIHSSFALLRERFPSEMKFLSWTLFLQKLVICSRSHKPFWPKTPSCFAMPRAQIPTKCVLLFKGTKVRQT